MAYVRPPVTGDDVLDQYLRDVCAALRLPTARVRDPDVDDLRLTAFLADVKSALAAAGPQRVRPPKTGDGAIDRWAREVSAALARRV